MTRFVGAIIALVLSIGFVACDSASTGTPSTTAKAATATDTADGVFSRIETELSDIVRRRDVRAGWAAEARPGDARSTDDVIAALIKFENMDEDLLELPTSDKVAGLRVAIAKLELDDTKLLLRKARAEQNISALDQFLKYAQKLDVDPKEDFGVDAAGLRAEALTMAKSYVSLGIARSTAIRLAVSDRRSGSGSSLHRRSASLPKKRSSSSSSVVDAVS